jgi:hypothetical protein
LLLICSCGLGRIPALATPVRKKENHTAALALRSWPPQPCGWAASPVAGLAGGIIVACASAGGVSWSSGTAHHHAQG